MQTMQNNTRKYHRSSILAFPATTDYACALEIFNKETNLQKTFKFAAVIAALSLIALAIAIAVGAPA